MKNTYLLKNEKHILALKNEKHITCLKNTCLKNEKLILKLAKLLLDSCIPLALQLSIIEVPEELYLPTERCYW